MRLHTKTIILTKHNTIMPLFRQCLILFITILTICCLEHSNGFLQSRALLKSRKPQLLFNSKLSANDKNNNNNNDEERRNGFLVLLTVPVAWGSFEPATRFVYATDPALPSLLFSAAYYIVAAVTLLSLALFRTSEKWPVHGGLELGLYLFVGNLLQVLGLKTVPSDRAAFLLQLTTILVPLLEASRSKAVSKRTWLACFVALLGVAVMGLDTSQSSVQALSTHEIINMLPVLSNGDLMIAGAALSYSFHCIRLEKYAQTTSAVKLAASKAVTETVCTFLTILAVLWYSALSNPVGGPPLSTFASESGNEIINYVSNHPFIETNVIAAICWTGWVTVAYTIYAQSYGQSRVRPTTANLIYTIQPLCTALIAWSLLGESLGPFGWCGGLLIGLAVLLVALPSNSNADELPSSSVNNSQSIETTSDWDER